MKNTKKSLRRRVARSKSTILWDNIHKNLYVVDIPKNGESRFTGSHNKGNVKRFKTGAKDFLLRNRDRAEMAANFMRHGRAFTNTTPATQR